MITISFETRGNLGLCEFISSSIKKQILEGTLKTGEKLPSKRSLAENLGVSVITIQNAYMELISEGYIYSIEKKGFFVSDLLEFSASNKRKSEPKTEEKTEKSKENWLYDFSDNSIGFEKFPFSLWNHTIRSVLNSGDEKLLGKIGAKGALELRSAISEYLREFRNMKVSSHQIVIGAGTENLYAQLVQLLGNDKLYALENPGYSKVEKVFSLNGARTVPIELDESGLPSQKLEESRADIVHLSPSHHFPTGIVMPIKRRQEILSWAMSTSSKSRRFIIEDDYDSEFRFNGKPLPTLQSIDPASCVIYINTFSKTLAPSFRISYMVLPESLVRVFEEKIGFCSCPVSAFEQYTLAKFINDGNFEKHIIRMKNYYRSLRNNFIGAINNSALSSIVKIHEEEAGLHFLIKFDCGLSGKEITERLLERKIKLPLLSDFYYRGNCESEKSSASSDRENFKNTFVVNYSGLKKEMVSKVVEQIEKSIVDR